MHLNELAKRVGVTKSCLSQIENGKSFPSILTLKKIADNLNTTIGDLVGEKDRSEYNPLITVEERKFVNRNTSGASLYLLAHYDPNKQMETYFIRFDVDADSSNLLENHHGQAFYYVINGNIEITLNERNYVLKEGDCFYYNSADDHFVKNINSDFSEAIWTITHSNI